MILTLQILEEPTEALSTSSRKVFRAVGGTIGRLPDNDWVFSDPYISGRHALVRYLNGKYYIEDTSTNGVAIHSPENRISRSDAQLLSDGDVLYMDAYQIGVSIRRDPQFEDPFACLQRAAASRVPADVSRSRGEDCTVGLEPVKHNAACLGPADAVSDAFRDLHDHQAASLDAMRVAFESMLAQFDPDRLQDEFDRRMKKSSIPGVPARLRYWELYRDKYGIASRDAEAAFRGLFADAFSAAYEEQMERRRAGRHGRTK